MSITIIAAPFADFHILAFIVDITSRVCVQNLIIFDPWQLSIIPSRISTSTFIKLQDLECFFFFMQA